MLEISAEKWIRSMKVLSGTSQIVANDPYELRIAGLKENRGKWKLISARVSLADKTAGVTVEPKPTVASEEGWLRVLINSQESRPVKWSLQFARD
jgi:hypothetical protein